LSKQDIDVETKSPQQPTPPTSTPTLNTSLPTRVELHRSSGYDSSVLISEDNTVLVMSQYPSLVANRVSLTQGRWYYEVQIINVTEKDARLTIGWADKVFFGEAAYDKGVGDNNHSWGLTFRVGTTTHIAKRSANSIRPSPCKWQPGDIFGCGVDVNSKTLFFSINGIPIDISFDKIDYLQALTPALSLNRLMKCQVNFGEKSLMYLPHTYQPVHKSLTEEKPKP